MTRTNEHQQDSIKGKWKSSGATEHCLKCNGQFKWSTSSPCSGDEVVQLVTPRGIIQRSHWKFKDRSVTVVNRI